MPLSFEKLSYKHYNLSFLIFCFLGDLCSLKFAMAHCSHINVDSTLYVLNLKIKILHYRIYFKIHKNVKKAKAENRGQIQKISHVYSG